MAKGGKGRKGGGGGGGKTRKYSRDNNGRFASTGTGATARGGRLLTAKGNKRKTKTMEAGGAKAAGTIKGKVKRDPAAASKIAQRKAAAKPTTPKPTATIQRGARLGGEMVKTSLPKPGTVAPMKGQDKAFQSLANLKKAETFSSPKAPIKSVFLPREQMTASRAQKVGLIDRNGFRRSTAESPRMRVTEITSGSRQGYSITPRSGVKANEPRKRATGTVSKPKGLKLQTKPSAAKPAATPKAAKPAPKGKTKTQTLQQADRIMGKLAKRQASIQVDKVGLDEGMRQVQRNNKRGGIVNRALNKRGLLGEYQKLTAGADPIRMTAAGKGIKQPTAKPAKATMRKGTVGKISEAKAGRIIARIDANRPGLKRAPVGSMRKTTNSVKTQRKATDFVLAASAKARKQGKTLSVNESLQRGVKNAKPKKRPMR